MPLPIEKVDLNAVPADEVCPTHGPYEDHHHWRHRAVRCADCDRAGDAYRHRLEQDELRNERFRNSGLVGWTGRATFESYMATLPEQQKALEACRALVVKGKKRGDTPWLLGPPGTGKTHLGSAMVNYVIRECEQAAAIHSARDIVRKMRATWGNREAGRSEPEVLEGLADLSLLVIDELGVGFGSNGELVQLFDVIDLRYRLERPTALISNFSVAELKPVLGDAAFDRLRQGARVVPMNWPSHRGSLA